MRRIALVCLMLSSVMMSGCLPLLLGGVAAGAYYGTQDMSPYDAVDDLRIKTHIKDLLTGQNYRYLTGVEVSVMGGKVLLTGVVANPQQAAEVESTARSVKGVADVYNELYTDGIYPATQYSKDTWLVTQIKSLMFKDEVIKAVNYQVQAVNSHVYIFGFANSGEEMERVRHLVRTTKGVSQVHSYIKVHNLVTKGAETLNNYYSPTAVEEDL